MQNTKLISQVAQAAAQIKANIGQVLVGKDDVVELILAAVLSAGHVLIEDVPGIGKTTLARALANSLDCVFKRIQCTPDLLPSDITGIHYYNQQSGAFEFRPGPIIAQVVLADEINRATPRTQSALLEAMGEGQVTVDETTVQLTAPFLVLATQNPIELEGTFPLPEAQLDRFMFNVIIDYLPEDDEVTVVSRTTSGDPEPIDALLDGNDILRFHEVVRMVPAAEEVVRYAVQLTSASRPGQAGTPDFIDQWVSWGAGLRASQNMVLGAKAQALLDGRTHITVEDIQSLAHATLRHRILVGYRAEAEGVSVEKIIDELLQTVPVPTP